MRDTSYKLQDNFASLSTSHVQSTSWIYVFKRCIIMKREVLFIEVNRILLNY